MRAVDPAVGGSPRVSRPRGKPHRDLRTLLSGALDRAQLLGRRTETLKQSIELLRAHFVADVQNGDVEKRRAERSEIHRRVASLSPRQREVMTLVVAGKANKVIASELGVSQKTIESHRFRVMEKMKAKSLADLVRMSILAAEPGKKS